MTLNSSLGNFQFQPFNEVSVRNTFESRVGEDRVGEVLFKKSNSRFVILGIEESIGPLANFGQPGSEKAFGAFLKCFLNTQVYQGFKADEISILGTIKHMSSFKSHEKASKEIEDLDQFVFHILLEHINDNQIPIIIGGGHNNAYPLMKWASKKGILNVINLDPHADCRATDRRHSGNSFSFALEEKILNKYAVLGLHEAFNNNYIRKFLNNNNIKHTFYEEYIFNERSLLLDVSEIINTWQSKFNLGIEIDMDCISGMPSSAFSPSGWTLDQVRAYLVFLIKNMTQISYLHLPEAAPQNDIESKIVGKALTYLIRDFVINFDPVI